MKSEENGLLLNNGEENAYKAAESKRVGRRTDDHARQRELQQEVDALRQALLDFEALHKQKDVRLKVLRNLSNPWPEWNENNQPNGHRSEKRPQLPEANAAPVPHAVFRRILKEAQGFKTIRQILRAQLLRCEIPKDVMRIVAVAMQTQHAAKELAALSEPIIRAMYRCRNNVTDPEVLRMLNIITTRLNMAGLYYDPQLLFVGLKFAARSRSLLAMKRFLHLIRRRGYGISSNIFRSVIAKFSIGHRGLGEIRNGRWRREQLLQVLTGFDDCAHLPPEQQYHLGSFLVREDWQYLHGWVAVLARCRDSEGVWREWELWRNCPARSEPKALNGQETQMTTKLRGDYWFVEQMAYAGDLKLAWQLIKETGLSFQTLKARVKSRLLEGVEHATIFNGEVRDAMLWKYDLELGKIENALGVRWCPCRDDGGEGIHVLIEGQSQEETLEKLAAEDFNVEANYGFPYEEGSPIVEVRDRALHDAREQGTIDELRSPQNQYAGRGAGNMSPTGVEAVRRRSPHSQ